MKGAALALTLVLILALVLDGVLSGSAALTRAHAQGSEELIPQTDASLPARNVTMLGATPQEPGAGADEVWGLGLPGGSAGEGAGAVLVRYTAESGWSLGAPLENAAGQTLGGFKRDSSPLAGQMTPTGAGVLVGTVPGSKGSVREPVVLVRDPAGAFQEPAEAPPLQEGEALFSSSRAPLLAPLDEGEGKAGALIVPVEEAPQGIEHAVLHWDGRHWTREAIEVPAASSTSFRVLAIGASSPSNAWLLAQLAPGAYPAGAVALFRRMPTEPKGSAWSWQPAALLPGAPDKEAHALTVPAHENEPGGGTHSTSKPFTAVGAGQPPTIAAQALTVTAEGIWIDGERADVHTVRPASTTIFFKPQREAAAGQVTSSWCILPEGAPAGTAQCEHPLPEALPSGPSRSIAWANPSTPYGERVITGLPEGVSLTLRGTEFERVPSIGESAGADPGGALGAAFVNAHEGWLGFEGLPVHLTITPAASRLTPWPVPFRDALTAIAPQPGAPAGALSSEALAVGDQGEVARFKPGRGWVPESLFGPGERIERPRLRAVAWPRPQRAYAVGDHGQMWLWRGETGLWERDPATPANFRGNLLGVAFDPGNPARGFAVGSSAVGLGGVLLRYGKTWTQAAPLPPQVEGASFTSIAFSGSEAIVAYRKLLSPERDEYAGGLLIEDGAGWQLDAAAAALMGANAPLAVAGLPDGGAAFSTIGPEGTRIFERQSAGAPWQPTPQPLTGSTAGSLALFREGGALRAIATSGGAAENYTQEREPTPLPGFPPNLIGPYPIDTSGPASGLLRQTATGWSDESHELNPAGEPEGGFIFYDLPYRPEPVLAAMVDPSGAQGWAVGGEIHPEPRLDTASVERYPADGVAPLGAGHSQIPLQSGDATFAIGGDAQCAAICADRDKAGIGPDVWLTNALGRASQIGVRAFLYTGPRITDDRVEGLSKPVVPFEREFERYAAILGSAGTPAYAAPSPQDLDARPEAQGNESLFGKAFAYPYGAPEPQRCQKEVGCEGAYYALSSGGTAGAVRVIVLDDTRDVDESQRAWLAGQLQSASAAAEPAIVVGNADLSAQIAAGDTAASELAQVLGSPTAAASAYFYDAPEENIEKKLTVGSVTVPTFGSGTLGYVNVFNEHAGNFHGASGFLLGEVGLVAYQAYTSSQRGEHHNQAPVAAKLIPNIAELALEAKDGVLLRRSAPALFDALARRPRAGGRAQGNGGSQEPEIDPYIPIPSNCVGSGCESYLLPEYTFSSSRPDIGGFVKPNLLASDPHAVRQNPKGEPEREPINPATGVEESKSGLFCAYNPGTTIVTIHAGGLSASLPVTVQAGSVREPCGTVPSKEARSSRQTLPTPPPPAPAPGPANSAPAASPPPIPLPPAPAIVPPAVVRAPPPRLPPPFFVPLAAPLVPVVFVPPPLPPAANPTPPSGTSAVTSPVEAAQREEEEEEATESVSNQALAYRAPEHEPSPLYVLGAVVLAAFAGASVRRRPRGDRRDLRVAPATLSSARAQRRMAAEGGRATGRRHDARRRSDPWRR